MLACCSWNSDNDTVDDSQSVVIGEVILDQTIGPKQHFEDEIVRSKKYRYHSQGSLSSLEVVTEEDDNYKVDQSSFSSNREKTGSSSSLASQEQDPELKINGSKLSGSESSSKFAWLKNVNSASKLKWRSQMHM